jgi:hypothetical protein
LHTTTLVSLPDQHFPGKIRRGHTENGVVPCVIAVAAAALMT